MKMRVYQSYRTADGSRVVTRHGLAYILLVMPIKWFFKIGVKITIIVYKWMFKCYKWMAIKGYKAIKGIMKKITTKFARENSAK